MFRSGIWMMLITMISRLLGFGRTIVITYFFDDGVVTDAYFSAFKISNLFRSLLGEGALGTAFIPLYNERLEKGGDGNKFIYSVLNILFLIVFILSLGMLIFSDGVINLIVKGYPDETKIIASKLLKIMSFYLLFIGLSGMISAILNNFKIFIIPAMTSIFFNLSIILFGVFLHNKIGIESLAYGVLFGGILQFLVVLPSFFKRVKGYKFQIDFKDPYLKTLFFLICPMLLGIFARQFNSVIDQYFASYLPKGGVTSLEIATRLYNLPLGVFGVTLGTIIYPSLSREVEKKNFDEVEDLLLKGLNILQFLIIPSMLVFFIYSKEIIDLAFPGLSESGIITTSQSLIAYTIGLFSYTGIYLLSRAYYGMKNTKDPVKFAIISIVLNIILNWTLIGPYKHVGLALGTSLSSVVNFVLLLYFYRKKYIKLEIERNLIFAGKSIVVGVAAIYISTLLDNFLLGIGIFAVLYLGTFGRGLYRKKMSFF